jgi:hypothetical protein
VIRFWLSLWNYPLSRQEEVRKRLKALRLSYPTTKCFYERLVR